MAHIMVNGTFSIEKVRERKAEIAAERERLAEEEAELDTALAVYERFSESQNSSLTEAGNVPRPSGAPTTWKMVEGLLGHPNNASGLSGAALVEMIGHTWWPGVQGPQLLPTIYRFLKTGRLVKNEAGLFTLPTSSP